MLLGCTGDEASWVQVLAKQAGSEGGAERLTALAQAAALSVRSSHPISQAVLACAQSAGSSLPQLQLQDFHQQPGLIADLVVLSPVLGLLQVQTCVDPLLTCAGLNGAGNGVSYTIPSINQWNLQSRLVGWLVG